jgi:dephospho-CoA kinase
LLFDWRRAGLSYIAFDLLRDTMEGMMRIGLTGGIAAGKSTVAQHLNNLGLTVIDYDALARQVVAPGSEGLRQIVQEFGNGAVTADGQLNRAWMAEHVFGEHAAPGARERLDAIEHPLIYEAARRIERSIVGNASIPCNDTSPQPPAIVVHDVPLLAEVIGSMPLTSPSSSNRPTILRATSRRPSTSWRASRTARTTWCCWARPAPARRRPPPG